MKVSWILPVALLAACSEGGGAEATSATLYRNSPLDTSMRVHFATFDAPDGGSFNIDNCGMAARILNANVDASAEGEGKPRNKSAGFWCEPGKFAETGNVPASFESEFPSNSRAQLRF